MSNAGVLEALVRLLGEALAPLEHRMQGAAVETLVAELGLDLPSGTMAAGGVPQALQASSGACGQLPAAVEALVSAVAGGDAGPIVAAAATLTQRIVAAGNAFGQLGSALEATGGPAAAGLGAELPGRLVAIALSDHLTEHLPAVHGSLFVAGLLDRVPVPGTPYFRTELRLDRLTGLFKDPSAHLRDLYGFGTPGFDGLELFRRVKEVVDAPDAEAQLIIAPGMSPALDAFLFRLAISSDSPPGLRIRLRQAAEQDLAIAEPFGGPWSVTADAKARFEGGLEFMVSPDGTVRLEPPLAQATVEAAFGIKAARADNTPMVLLGQADKSRIELKAFSVRLPVNLSAATGTPSPKISFGAEARIEGGRLVIDTASADGFIASLLSGVRIDSGFDLTALYDTVKGLRFTGSATIEIAIPTHAKLGPVAIPNLYLVGGFKDGTLPVEFSADLAADLGPLDASVSRLGAIATISFPKGGGNAGPAQVDIAFKAPNGIGLSVDAGVVKGGGFLYFDTDRGEYAGTLELTFAGFLSLKAIGIITTRMPDGSKGFSLLVIITAEFGTGIQLGWGFTLLAVGGLLGLHRSMRLDALAQGVRSGSINSVMFPKDVVANAPRIISDLRTFFPPQQGTFLIGPMAKLGWGTPTLVSLSLGVLIEIPGNVAIVGVLKVALPAEDVAVVVLQVSFIGAVEFDKSRGWFFASLYDSRVLFITIDGDMGLLVAWGNDADFVLAVGGFHPRYTPPPLPFPSPHRISIDIVNTSVARIRAEGYFATTTNSVQFGCFAETFFGFSALNVSGHIQFDALIRFSPFYFIVDFSSHFSVKVFGVGVWGLRIRLEVEGPTPWHAKGSAGISLLFFDIDVDIEVTWGERKDTNLPPIAVLPKLVAELEKPDGWRALPPPGTNLLVSLRALSEEESATVLHPLGALQISQRFVPLDATLDRVGGQRPSDGSRFTLTAASTTFVPDGSVDEQFAPAQFEDLSDDDRLTRPAFEKRHGGIRLRADAPAYASGAAVVRVDRYELITIDTNAKEHRESFWWQGALLFAVWLAGCAGSASALSAKLIAQRVPVADGVKDVGETFAVALLQNNTAASTESVSFASQGDAMDWLASTVAANPTMAGTMHVVPQFELVGA